MTNLPSFRGLFGLTAGTIAVQGTAAILQFLLAIWLTPAQFGYWAAAVGALAICSGLVNGGEVNGLLANPDRMSRDAFRSARQFNFGLLALGALIALVYYAQDQHEVAWLIAISALALPITGSNQLAYAALMRPKAYRAAVAGQALGSVARFTVGVVTAVATGSAVAFAASLAAYAVISRIVYQFYMARYPVDLHQPRSQERRPSPKRRRLTWAVQAFAQYMPTQVDYLVVSLVAAPSFLGVYFLAYQITSAISGFVISPLSKSFLAALSAVSPDRRESFASALQIRLLGWVALAGCGLIIAADLVAPFVPPAWENVVPITAVLAASMPARFLVPVTDAVLMANGRWRRSITLHMIDGLGTAASALTAYFGNPALLASAVCLWKISIAVVRVLSASQTRPARSYRIAGVLVGLSTILLLAGLLTHARLALSVLAAVLAIITLLIAGGKGKR